MRRFLKLLLAAAFVAGVPVAAQFSIPEIAFDSVDPLKFPDNIHLGEAAGVATNSKGDIFVFTRTGHPNISIGSARAFARGGTRMFQLDRTGKFTREIGQGLYSFEYAQQVRVDPQDFVWIVDQMSNTIIKFDTDGRIVMLLGRKAEAEAVPARGTAPAAPAAAPAAAAPGRAAGPAPAPAAGGRGAGGGGGGDAEGGGGRVAGPPGTGGQQDVFNRPADVAWDAAGNIYVADGLGNNNRIAKFDKAGKFIKSWGFTGLAQGQFRQVHGIAIDAQGMVYVADAGNRRIQVFDADGNFKTMFLNVGTPAALCITPGPKQFLYTSNSNPPEDIDVDGEIYKMELNGKIVGRFGRAGKAMKEFGSVNAIDCRTENDLYVAEIGNWRVQKLTLHPK